MEILFILAVFTSIWVFRLVVDEPEQMTVGLTIICAGIVLAWIVFGWRYVTIVAWHQFDAAQMHWMMWLATRIMYSFVGGLVLAAIGWVSYDLLGTIKDGVVDLAKKNKIVTAVVALAALAIACEVISNPAGVNLAAKIENMLIQIFGFGIAAIVVWKILASLAYTPPKKKEEKPH